MKEVESASQSLQLELAIGGGESKISATSRAAPLAGVQTLRDAPPPPRSSVVLIDGHNMLQRAAHGYPTAIHNSRGQDVTLLFGFMTLVRAALKSIATPSAIGVIFDGSSGANRRRATWSGYKPFAPTDDPLNESLADIAALCERADIEFLRYDSYEADDIIASIISSSQSCETHFFVVSTDQDFYALLTDNRVTVVNPMRRPEQRNIGRDEVMQRFGIECERWLEFKSLIGDKSDGVPGVRGIGPKRARALLRSHDSVDELLIAVGDPQVRVWWELLKFESVTGGLGVSNNLFDRPQHVYRTFPSAEHLLRIIGRW